MPAYRGHANDCCGRHLLAECGRMSPCLSASQTQSHLLELKNAASSTLAKLGLAQTTLR
jgi:hypothetical protein